jgi:hypothetical protein
MISILTLCVACAFPPECNTDSYLYQPHQCIDNLLRGPAVRYVPQPGDIVLATDKNVFWKITHDLALAGEPHSSMVVVRRHDGTLATLEAGPNDTFFCDVLDMLPHLQEYTCKGPVWVRKRCTPLTCEQSACLTEFAMAAKGKRFALGRLGLQLTPFRTRGPVRTEYVGHPHGLRSSFFCSELVTEALVAAGVLDAAIARPSATYPHELFFDKSLNRYLNQNFSLAGCWEPPARWTSCPLTPILMPDGSLRNPGPTESLPFPKEFKKDQ